MGSIGGGGAVTVASAPAGAGLAIVEPAHSTVWLFGSVTLLPFTLSTFSQGLPTTPAATADEDASNPATKMYRCLDIMCLLFTSCLSTT
jgi:hypothetical protein